MRVFTSLLVAIILSGLPSPAAQSSPQPPTSHPTAAEFSDLKAKAEAGDPPSQEALGKFYEQGEGVSRNDVEAVKWYRKAAEQGYGPAEDDLGVMYRLGLGVDKSKEEAVRWYRKAAKHGNAQAMFNLGAAYYNGDGVNSDLTLADVWFLLAEDAGSAPAKDAAKRTAAEQSLKADFRAMALIAGMYEKGDELSQNDSAAVQWYRRAAEGIPETKVKLAAMLIDGKGAARDYKQAFDLCKSAALGGVPDGQFCVGYFYERGVGTLADSKEAAKWYRQASDRGDIRATLRLSEMYLKGEGVAADRAEAYFFYFSAYSEGSADARLRAIALFKELNKDEVKKLEKRLRDLRLDPKKVFAAVENDSIDQSRTRLALPAITK